MRRSQLAAAAFVVTALVAAALLISGQISLVTTFGTSMQPTMAAGDLVLVSRAPAYAVGEIAAYRSDMLETAVLHRVIASDGVHYTFQGDNNSWVDPEQPSADDLIGKQFLHIPQGGIWLNRLTHPAALAIYAFALMISGGATAQTRRKRRRRTMSQHAIERPRRTVSVSTLPPALKTAAGITVGAGVLAVALGAFGWSGPVEMPGTASNATAGQEMTFSYSADVPLTPAYDDTTVESPQPVFRNLTDTVDLHYAYTGGAGAISVAAELSTASGWRSTVPLAGPVDFDDAEHEGTVTLDLADFDARAAAAAEVTGLPADQLTVSVVPTVTTSAGESFSPSLALTLTPLTLALAGDAETLTTQDSGAEEGQAMRPRTLDLVGFTLSAEMARLLSAALAALVALASVALLVLARSAAPRTEGGEIHRRYASLLVPVQPMPTPSGRPVVDVTEFATLAKLAERYGLLVLHWTRSGVETFVVQDEGTTYRYRSGVRADHLEIQTGEDAPEYGSSV